jgi:ankyrin repeat protein/CubicO group peptidase (beta-lactamase class C family)
MKKRLILIIVIVLAIPALALAEETLLDAATNGDINFIKNYKGNINEPLNERGMTALMWAATNGMADTVTALIKAGAKINAVTLKGTTPLMFAAGNGDLATLKVLIKAGAGVNIENQFGYTAIMAAAEHGHLDAMKLLKEAGADENMLDKKGNTVLMYAANNGQTEAVKALISLKADPNIINNSGWTALMFAAFNGKTDIVKELIRAKADVNEVNQLGMTALIWAASKGNTDAVKALIDAKADVNAMDKDNCTALMWAEQNRQIETIKLLVEAGAKYSMPPDLAGTLNPGLIPWQGRTDDYYPGDAWRTSTPEAQGMDSGYFIKMLDYIQSNNINIHSVIIIRHGYVVLEAYREPFGRDVKQIIQSATKSFASALVGIAIKEGFIRSIDQKVTDIFSDWNIKNLDENKRQITIKHLLTMSSGISWDQSIGLPSYYQSPNRNQYYLDLPMEGKPGSSFNYSNPGVNLLMSAVQKTSRMRNSDFADKFLFKPIGITNYYWEKNPQGIVDGGGGLDLTPMEMARFGYLYLKKGKWNEKQVIPVDWVEASMTNHIDAYPFISTNKGYGYLWWELPFGGYTASGYGGQHILVMPARDMVVVFTAGNGNNNWRPEKYLTEEFINQSIVSSNVMPESPVKQAELTSLIRQMENPYGQPKYFIPGIVQKISGKKYFLDKNPWNWKAVTLTFNSDKTCILEGDWPAWIFYNNIITNKSIHFKMQSGLDGKYVENRFSPESDDLELSLARGTWIDENTFIIEYYRPCSDSSKIRCDFKFDSDGLEMKTESTIGEWRQDFIGRTEQ